MSMDLTGSAFSSPKCASVNRVCPGVSDRLKADVRQKSGTSNAPWSPSMPWIVDARRRCRNSNMLTLASARIDATSDAPAILTRAHIQAYLTYNLIHHSTIINQAYISLCANVTTPESLVVRDHPPNIVVYNLSMS